MSSPVSLVPVAFRIVCSACDGRVILKWIWKKWECCGVQHGLDWPGSE